MNWPNNRYPRVRRDGRMQYVHRLVWEKAHGPIPDGHAIHHINGDPTDNRLKNLALIARSDHGRVHGGEARNRHGRWAVKHDACIECGTTKRKHYARGMCNRCYQRVRWGRGRFDTDLRFAENRVTI